MVKSETGILKILVYNVVSGNTSKLFNMKYSEYLPSEKLKSFVLNYWIFEIPKKGKQKKSILHQSFPENSISIVMIDQPYYKGVRLLGPHNVKFEKEIYSGSIYFGVRLLPWIEIDSDFFIKEKVLNKTSDAPQNLITLFENINTHDLQSNINIIESRLVIFFNSFKIYQDDLVKYICINLSQGMTIKNVIENIPYSVRVIQKKFKKVTGLTMKQFANNLRLRNLWLNVLIDKQLLVKAIYDYDYYDYAHFVNDFKKKMRISPSNFKDYHSLINIEIPD